jgi:Glycosyl transferase family 2
MIQCLNSSYRNHFLLIAAILAVLLSNVTLLRPAIVQFFGLIDRSGVEQVQINIKHSLHFNTSHVSILPNSSTSTLDKHTFFQSKTDTLNGSDAQISLGSDKAAICAIVMNENLYIQEWVDYHLSIGFDLIRIYDNSRSNNLLNWYKNQSQHIEMEHFPGQNKQRRSYKICSMELRERRQYKWIAYIDVDEFIVLRKHDNIVTFLNEYLTSGALALSWMMVGSSGNKIYEPYPVTRRFQYLVGNTTVNLIKCIALVDDLQIHPKYNGFLVHYPSLKEKKKIRDTSGNIIDPPTNPLGLCDVACIFHYHTKSDEEYYQKRQRGRADLFKRQWKYIEFNRSTCVGNPGNVFDDIVWKTLTRNVPSYQKYDHIQLNGDNLLQGNFTKVS